MSRNPVRPEFVPDPSLSRGEMEQLQHDIADSAVFTDDLDVDPERFRTTDPGSADHPATDHAATDHAATDHAATDDPAQRRLGGAATEDESSAVAEATGDEATGDEPPIVAGVDQAFVDDRAVSAVVCLQNGAGIERVHAVEPTEIPYVPGLLSFREGGAILAALGELCCDPDLLLVDGSGRIHFREAGLATHVGVTVDVPTVGVAKSLLCGTPVESLDRKLPTGTRVAIAADDDVTAPNGTVLGYAVQTRQFEGSNRHVNPLYVSPGHRVGADTAATVVERCCAGYKLPEPTRLADSYADELKADVRE